MGSWALEQGVHVSLRDCGGKSQGVFLRNFRGVEWGFLMVGGVGEKGDFLVSRILGLFLGSQVALEMRLLFRSGRIQE